tara:strand:- start:72 stop:785 length:714 start_codon:yes stop_codon:yes gene_type:complete
MSKLQKVVKGTFNVEAWASKFFNATEDVISVAKELYAKYPDFKSKRTTDENLKVQFNKIKFQFCKEYIAKNNLDDFIGYYHLQSSGYVKVSKKDFEGVATPDTRLKGHTINMSLDSEDGIFAYTQKTAFLNSLKTKNPMGYELIIANVNKVKEGIRSKVKNLDDNATKESKITNRRNLSKSKSMVENIDRWLGKDNKAVIQAIDNGDALGLAWLEIKPEVIKLRKLFSDIVKRENQS